MVQANSKFKKTFQEAEDVFKKKQDENKYLLKELDRELTELQTLERDKSD